MKILNLILKFDSTVTFLPSTCGKCGNRHVESEASVANLANVPRAGVQRGCSAKNDIIMIITITVCSIGNLVDIPMLLNI